MTWYSTGKAGQRLLPSRQGSARLRFVGCAWVWAGCVPLFSSCFTRGNHHQPLGQLWGDWLQGKRKQISMWCSVGRCAFTTWDAFLDYKPHTFPTLLTESYSRLSCQTCEQRSGYSWEDQSGSVSYISIRSKSGASGSMVENIITPTSSSFSAFLFPVFHSCKWEGHELNWSFKIPW